MKTIVTGWREYRDYREVCRVLDKIHSERHISFLAHGDARGADRMAENWAKSRHVDYAAFPANWDGRGDAAGSFRNKLMYEIARPDLVVAFPGKTGTNNMIMIAKKGGTEIIFSEDV